MKTEQTLELSLGIPFENPKLTLPLGITYTDFARDYLDENNPRQLGEENVVSLKVAIGKYPCLVFMIFTQSILDEIVLVGIDGVAAKKLFGKPDREDFDEWSYKSMQWIKDGFNINYRIYEARMMVTFEYVSIRQITKRKSICDEKSLDYLYIQGEP